MRVLQICHKPPQPAIDGGCIAMNNITKGFLKNRITVKLITICTTKHPFKAELIEPELLNQTNLEAVFVDTEINIVDAFSSLVTSDSYNISRFFSPDFDRLLKQTLEDEQFDVVHIESLFMTPYIATIKRYSKAKLVLRSHNLEYMIWERLANSATNTAKKVYLKILAKQLKEYEANVVNEVDGVASITDEDGEKYRKIGCYKPIVTIPFGIDLNQFNYQEYKTKSDKVSLFHLGSMDWKPNLEGVAWFGERIWPTLNQEFPYLKLNIAGRNMPNWLLKTTWKNISNYGEVSSAKAFMLQHDIMVVPLLSAGGMRIKIIEGMALGKVVLSTSVGAEGIDYTDRENILIANKKSEFILQLKWLLEDTSRMQNIGENARKLVEKKYNNEVINHQLVQFYNSLQK